MSRGTPSSVTTPYRSETPDPLWLLDLETGSSPANVRLASFDADVVWAGVTWTARAFEVDQVPVEGHGEVSGSIVRIADADAYFKTLRDAGADFHGQRVRIYQTDASLAGAGAVTDAIRNDWFVERHETVHGVFVLHLRPLVSVFDIEVPLGTVTRTEFPGVPDLPDG